MALFDAHEGPEEEEPGTPAESSAAPDGEADEAEAEADSGGDSGGEQALAAVGPEEATDADADSPDSDSVEQPS